MDDDVRMLFLCLHQAGLAGKGITFSAVHSFVRPYSHPSVHLLPNLWAWQSENKWTDFAAKWHKWPMGQSTLGVRRSKVKISN